jgi:hypothetical protein
MILPVEPIHQKTDSDCGVACVEMLLNYFETNKRGISGLSCALDGLQVRTIESFLREKGFCLVSGNYDVPTEIIFGFAEKLINLFSQFDPTQTLVVVHPPGTRIGFHVDTGNYVKIHLPIKSNSQSLFEYNDKVFVMEPGYAYLTNVSIPHATINNGTTDRVHLIFRVSDKFISMLETQEFVV